MDLPDGWSVAEEPGGKCRLHAPNGAMVGSLKPDRETCVELAQRLAGVETAPDPTEGALSLAESEDVDLSEVEGTGKDGRITKSDVEAAL